MFGSSKDKELERQLVPILDAFIDPLIGRGLNEAGAIRNVTVKSGRALVALELAFPAGDYGPELAARVAEHVRAALGVEAEVQVGWQVHTHAVQKNLQPLPGIRNIIAVASGKGGVGKSTVAVNLALALRAEGARVGILDADIYGPSQPTMLGIVDAKPASSDGKRMDPLEAHGLQAMSLGFLVDPEQPTIWRGPMATQALMQLLTETRWNDLDYLVIDLPPGTGDIQLTLSQRIPISGAVVVTTPQDIALIDARKGAGMFHKVEVTVLGVVENMSFFCCPNCGHQTAIFGSGGGDRLASETGVELLGRLPLDARIQELADGGKPTVVSEPASDSARRYRDIALKAAARLAYGAVESFPEVLLLDD